MRYMLDTNICIYLINKKPLYLKDKFQKTVRKKDELLLSAITAGELFYGIDNSANPDKNRVLLVNFLIAFNVAAFDEEASIEYGRVRTYLKRNGIPIGPNDTLIASHAISLNAVLITNNEREFKKVPGLIVENWVSLE